jgi:hypothetical protein
MFKLTVRWVTPPPSGLSPQGDADTCHIMEVVVPARKECGRQTQDTVNTLSLAISLFMQARAQQLLRTKVLHERIVWL